MQTNKWYRGPLGYTVDEMQATLARRQRLAMAMALKERDAHPKAKPSTLSNDAWLQARRAAKYDR